MSREEDFKATNNGWVSPETPPVNNFNVLALVWCRVSKLYYERIGYFENRFELRDIEDLDPMVVGWIPIPSHPDLC